MKKLLLFALPAALLLASCGSEKTHHGKTMAHKSPLTEEQKSCIKKHNCKKPESEKDKAAWEKFKECKKSAFKACGIETKHKVDDKYAVEGGMCLDEEEFCF